MFRCPSSMKENRNWLSKTTLEEESGADSIIYPESHFWLVAAAGSGMYSCPVATMFCEKLLTRRDIAENLRASVIWIRLSFCVVGKKVKMFEKIVVSIQKLTPCNDTAWRETHRRIIFTFFESCCTNMKTLHSSIGNFIWNISPDFWYFILEKRWKLTTSECQSSRFASMARLRARTALDPAKEQFVRRRTSRSLTNLEAFSPGLVVLKSPRSQSPCEQVDTIFIMFWHVDDFWYYCSSVFQLSMLGNGPCISCRTANE